MYVYMKNLLKTHVRCTLYMGLFSLMYVHVRNVQKTRQILTHVRKNSKFRLKNQIFLKFGQYFGRLKYVLNFLGLLELQFIQVTPQNSIRNDVFVD